MSGESSAHEVAMSEGCPDVLFRGLCEWIERPEHVVDSEVIGLRYSPNTRALALARWRLLRGWASIMGDGK